MEPGRRYVRDMRRLAPSFRTPRFKLGDVLATMDPDVWINPKKARSPYYRLLWTVFAALAVCARIAPHRAVTFLLADYEADRLRVPTRNGHSYPVILLPAARAAIDRYLKLRRELRIGGDLLLVSDDGSPLQPATAPGAFRELAEQYGMFGHGIVDELIAFHDSGFRKEADRSAVVVLHYGRSRHDEDVPRGEIAVAREDPDRLRIVLNRCHRLKGEAGRWIGGHAKAKIAAGMSLFKPVRSHVRITEFMRTDEVCLRLLREDWTGRDLIAQRAPLLEKYFPYLASCCDRKPRPITPRQIGYLFNLSADRVRDLLTARRRADETPEKREARTTDQRRWLRKIPEMYAERAERERPGEFYRRVLKTDPDYPFEWTFFLKALATAGVAPAQVERLKNGVDATGKKVGKRTALVREKAENGMDREGIDGPRST